MNSRFILTLCACFLCHILSAQKHDNVWPGGLNEYPEWPGNGQYLIRFDQGEPEVEPADLGLNFESTVAAYSDSAGQLLYYTNGCAIFNANGDTLHHGGGLNPGIVADWTCGKTGYICPRGAMFIPWPGYEDKYCFLLHMGMDYAPDRGLTYGPFYASFISKLGVAGIGTVFYKNEIFLSPSYVSGFTKTFEPFAVVRHGNGRDWWIIIPEYGKNKYHIFLVIPQGIYEQPEQIIGTAMKCTRIGSSTFSPDGAQYARQQNCGVQVMDFNRCTGHFSNPRWIPAPESGFGGGGVAFSTDNDQLITDSYLAVLKADLTQTNPVFDTLVYPDGIFGTSLHHMQYGPDGRLYFNSLQRTQYLPTLADPFGPNPVFEQKGVVLPVYSVRSLPYFPNYRLYDFPDSPCDTLGIDTPVATHAPEPAASVNAWPNPVSNTWRLEVASSSGRLLIFDLTGRVMWQENLGGDGASLSIPVQDWPSGMYFWQLRLSGGSMRSGCFVKI